MTIRELRKENKSLKKSIRLLRKDNKLLLHHNKRLIEALEMFNNIDEKDLMKIIK